MNFFFRFFFRNRKSCVYNCDDLPSYNSSRRSSHIRFSYVHNFITAVVVETSRFFSPCGEKNSDDKLQHTGRGTRNDPNFKLKHSVFAISYLPICNYKTLRRVHSGHIWLQRGHELATLNRWANQNVVNPIIWGLARTCNSPYSKIAYYNTLCFPPNFCLTIVYSFSWDDCRYQETTHVFKILEGKQRVLWPYFWLGPLNVCMFAFLLTLSSFYWKSFCLENFFSPIILLGYSWIVGFSLTSLLKSVLTKVRTLVKEMPRRELQELSGNVQHYLRISLSVQALMIRGQFRTLL